MTSSVAAPSSKFAEKSSAGWSSKGVVSGAASAAAASTTESSSASDTALELSSSVPTAGSGAPVASESVLDSSFESSGSSVVVAADSSESSELFGGSSSTAVDSPVSRGSIVSVEGAGGPCAALSASAFPNVLEIDSVLGSSSVSLSPSVWLFEESGVAVSACSSTAALLGSRVASRWLLSLLSAFASTTARSTGSSALGATSAT